MRILVAGGIIWLIIGTLLAEGILTWEACVQETVHHNPDLAAAQEAVQKARSQYYANYAGFLPQLSANVSATRANSTLNLGPLGLVGNIQNQYNTGLSFQQNLFTGLRDTAQVKKSRADLDTAEAALQLTQAQVSNDLKSAFAKLLYAQEQLKLAGAIAGRRQENVRLVQLRFEVGRENKGSYLRTKADDRLATFEVAQARRALRVAQREVTKVLGRSEFGVITVVGSFPTPSPGPMPNFPDLTLQTPTHRQAEAQARGSQAGVSLARSEFFPSVDATGSVGRSGTTWPPDRDRWSMGGTLNYAFFPGGRHVFDVRGAMAERRRAQWNVQSIDHQVALSLEQAFSRFQDAAEKIEVQQEFLTAAEVRAEIARSQYTNGLLSFQDWDLIESDLITQQKQMLVVRRDAMIAEAAWEQAQGKGFTR
ncbi:MAG: TolC family protein [Elusimicrobia bacterium]|nr:TolC family protein [Elusimicrobiota bacterium]